MDDIDVKALKYLMKIGRASWAELSGVLGLSSPSTADRVRRMEESGVIRGYAALVEPELVGCNLTAFVCVTLEHPKYRHEFIKRVHELVVIQECHHITGEHDYLLKIRCASPRHLESIISDELKAVPGVVKTMTSVALSTLKETVELFLQETVASESVRQ